MVKISDLIANFLEEKNIDTVFGIIGSANAHIFDSIINKGYTKVVYMHHEQSVVLAAGAYYRSSGKMSAAIVTAGGGASNAITGIVSNWADSIPCLILSGQESTQYVKNHRQLRMLGTQGFNSYEVIKPISKYSKCVLNKEDTLKYLQEAYYTCLEGRPGPVWLEIPFDIQGSNIEESKIKKFRTPECPKTDSKIDLIVKLISESSRPVILAGHGIKLADCKKEFKELVSRLKIPVLTSWSAMDLLTEDDPYNFGRPGLYGQRRSNFVIQNCDLLIAIGSRLSLPLTGYNLKNFSPEAKIVMVNNDQKELDNFNPYLKINDNCKNFISNLKHVNIDSYREVWYKKCIEYKQKFSTIEQHHLDDNINYDNSYITVDEISKYAKDDAIIVFGQGTPLASGHQAFKVKGTQTVFCSNGLGEMGNEMPSAIGACFPNPNRQVICLISDGSMMMNLQELQTIVGYKTPIKFILFNNEGYLFIKHTQKMLFNGRYTGVNDNTGVSLPNYEKVSYAFGLNYTNSKRSSLEDFLNSNGPGIYETFMNPEQDLSPKVKGIISSEGILAPPLEDMSPLLSLEEIKNNMINKINNISYQIKR
jgi:acetolactate synthase-1/2/3 large subunit